MQNWKRDTNVQNRLLDSVGEGEGGMFWENSIETSILSRVKQTTSPGWMHETSAQGWCTGKTQRDGMGGRWEGGSGWGTHVNPWLIHVNVWQKPLQYCKVISLQLIKINEKKKKKNIGMDCYSLLQGIFPTQESNLSLLHCRQILYRLSHQGSPIVTASLKGTWVTRVTLSDSVASLLLVDWSHMSILIHISLVVFQCLLMGEKKTPFSTA